MYVCACLRAYMRDERGKRKHQLKINVSCQSDLFSLLFSNKMVTKTCMFVNLSFDVLEL